jgi:uncharacterized membrane protein
VSTGYGFEPRTSEKPAVKQRGSLTVIGLAVGAVLAFAALLFGFWGFLLTAVFMAIGAVVGRVLDGSLDLRSLGDVLRGRSTSR